MSRDPNAERRREIVDAATSLFNRYGFKRTSVDAIAREAGVAKATVYAYFPGKEDVFRAVCAAVCDRILAQAAEAAQRGADLEARLQGVLEAKLVTVYELVNLSPHAREILESQSRIGAEIVGAADRDYARGLRALLSEAERAGTVDLRAADQTPESAARLLLQSASGVANAAKDARALKRGVRELVRLYLRALEPAGAASAAKSSPKKARSSREETHE